jgi:hypothetical protein
LIDALIFAGIFIGLFLMVVGGLWLSAVNPDGSPAYGGPRIHRIVYRNGMRTMLLTPREAYGLWHTFAGGDNPAMVWYKGDRVVERRVLH